MLFDGTQASEVLSPPKGLPSVSGIELTLHLDCPVISGFTPNFLIKAYAGGR
jgi:hypothetical protein